MQPQFTPKTRWFKDISGQRFGRLTAIDPVRSEKARNTFWRCLCDCGNEAIVRGTYLRSGHTLSCGCWQTDNRYTARLTHGLSDHRLYRVWLQMIARCTDPTNAEYHNYGARGISVCPEWLISVGAYIDHVSALPNYGKENYSLDRIDNDGNYEPSNMRWATQTEQNLNRRMTVKITFQGKTQTVTEWAAEYGISESTLRGRLSHGWTIERAMTAVVPAPRVETKLRGPNLSLRKLTDDQVRDIRASRGKIPLDALAVRHECSVTTIHNIQTYKTYKEVPD
jgi:hypothetical protein